MESSLILRVSPRYIGCHYYLTFLFSIDWLNYPSTLSFPEGWHSHPLVAFVMWIVPAPKLLIYISMDWHSHPTNYNFEDQHYHLSVHLISYGLALPPNYC